MSNNIFVIVGFIGKSTKKFKKVKICNLIFQNEKWKGKYDDARAALAVLMADAVSEGGALRVRLAIEAGIFGNVFF